MNNGAFGEGFPYTNFHDLNMDWIIKIAKDFLDQYTHIQEVIEQGLIDIQNLTDESMESLNNLYDTINTNLNEWYNTHSEDIANQLADALSDLNAWYNEHSTEIADQLLAALGNLNAWYTEHVGFLDDYVEEATDNFETEVDNYTTHVISTIPPDYSNLSFMISAIGSMVDAVLFTTWTDGYYYTSGGSTTDIDPAVLAESSAMTCAHITCSPGDKFRITGSGASAGRLWVWTNASGHILSRAESSAGAINELIIAPATAAHLYVNCLIANAHGIVKGDISNELNSFINSNAFALSHDTITLIPDNTDIDTLLAGNYKCNSGASASTMPHAPTTTSGFRLIVSELTLSDRLIQIAIMPNGTYDPYTKTIRYREKIGETDYSPWFDLCDTKYCRVETGIRNLNDFIGSGADLCKALTYIEGKNGNADSIGYTVYSYLTHLTDSEVASISYPLKVRDYWGNPLGKIYWSINLESSAATFAYGFDRDGYCVERYKMEDLLTADNGIPSNAYYLALTSYSNVDMQAKVSGSNNYVVDQNGGGDFTSFTACLNALADDDTEKTIYVNGGDYDILEELGGTAFLNSITGEEDWYDVCPIIPPNTTVIGRGIVTFRMELPQSTSYEVGILLSPLNIRGTATVKNVRVVANNCRYCIHPEGSKDSRFNNAIYKLENVMCEYTGTYNVGSTAPIACGLNNGVTFELNNCILKTVGNIAFSVHDQGIDYDKSPNVFFNNCVFDSQAYAIIMASTKRANMQTVIDVRVFNCYAGNLFMRKTSNSSADDTKDCFRAIYVNTPHRTQNSAQLIDIIPDIDYSNFN